MSDTSLSLISQASRRILACGAAALMLLLTAAPLHAHHLPPGMEDVDEFEDGAAFMAGLRHPLLGLDHCLFALAIGAMAVAVMRKRNSKNLVAALVLGSGAGAMFGVNEIMLPGAQFSVAAALLVPVLVFALKDRLSGWGRAGLVVAAALWQGNAHGLAWPLDHASGFYMTGMMVTMTLLACGGYAMAWAARTVRFERRAEPEMETTVTGELTRSL